PAPSSFFLPPSVRLLPPPSILYRCSSPSTAPPSCTPPSKPTSTSPPTAASTPSSSGPPSSTPTSHPTPSTSSPPPCATDASSPTLDLAIEVVREVDRPNVGMVIDTFHFYAGGSRLDDIARVPIDKLFVVHLNGCEDLPRGQLTDAHRLYPGEGPIPIEAILRALRTNGFDGTCSVEIFRPDYWQQDPHEVARTARTKA